MAPTISSNIPVIDFRRQSMVLEWNAQDSTWMACDVPPALVNGVALIRASQPNICLYARDGVMHLHVGINRYALSDDSPRIKWSRGWASFGLRRHFTIESRSGEMLLSHSYWTNQGDDFFSWLTPRAAQPEWRRESAQGWSTGITPTVLRSS